MSDYAQSHRQQPTRLPRPQDSPSKNTGVGCHFLLQCMKVKSQSEVAQLCPTLSYPTDCMQPTRLLRSWDFPGKSARVGCHCFLRKFALLILKPILIKDSQSFPQLLCAVTQMKGNFFFFGCCTHLSGISVPGPGTDSTGAMAVKAQNPNHGATRELPKGNTLKFKCWH